jgi:hypothetical protein
MGGAVGILTVVGTIAHVVCDRVHIPVVVIVNVSPAIETCVGTVTQDVTRTTTDISITAGVHVRTVTQGVSIVKVWQ